MSKEVWVKNTGFTSIQVKAVLKAATETTEEVAQVVTFNRYKVNPQSGLVESNGYTPVSKEVYAALMEKKVFKDLVNQETLVMYDAQPDDAITPAARLQMLSARIVQLEGFVTTLTAENEGLKKGGADKALQKDLKDAVAKNEALEGELAAAKEKIVGYEKKLGVGEFAAPAAAGDSASFGN